ncbi:LacI family DNA-binding transcriptional regulator [Leifsonia virtsii]|uniref:LacI family DNA-binding transcriptional regulator n=1 Tax=Leifsonia virtsii TaxID=3035915 RepID=A0ABT8IZE7_9MICO|nr:LacI family DNA-binding transcriptional regulator [Leifsonia virtsii]MDN4597752.1 LacI family DNA-binding transcriptional regulator [Leifsonia virtsii]
MTTEQVAGRVVPTLEAVAARAGVSRATVSRVVNGSPKVTPEVVAAVERAIADLNYVPNRAARSLASRRTQVIALVVPESTAKVFADPFFASIVQGVALSLADTEYTLNMVISSETNPDKTRRYLMGGNVDGALVVSHHSGDHSYAQLGTSLPLVFGGRPVSESQHASYYVDVDNVAGARVATEHLIQRGRRSIALITGPQDMPAGLDRFTGWKQAMDAAGLDTSQVAYGDFSPASGLEAMRGLLAAGRPIDGLFAANDQMAAGAYSAIHEAGLSIPGDVAVVGYDDDSFGLMSTPPLTTVHQPSIGLGETMARVLVRRLAGDPVDRVTLLPTELVIRQST